MCAAKASDSNDEVIYNPFQPLVHGVEHDVLKLLKQTVAIFDETNTLRIQHFHTVWRNMQFGLIFHGRQGFRELTEFTEDLLKIVKSYTLKNNEMGIRAAAVYLWYTLYFKQPTIPKVRLHVDKREYSDLCKFMKECREDRHWEVVYCWCKLIADHAFVFEASTNRCGIEFAGKGSKANKLLNLKKPKGFESFFNDNEYKEVFESIRQTHGKYSAMKKALTSGSSTSTGFDKGLSMASEDLPERLKEFSTPKAPRGASENTIEGNFLTENGVTIGQRRQRLIQQSYELNAMDDNDELMASDSEESPLGTKSKGKGKGKKSKPTEAKLVEPEIDGSQTIASLAKNLAAVKEDPSLLYGLEGGPVLKPSRGRGRPRKVVDPDEVQSPKKSKTKGRPKKKKDTEEW